MKSLAREHLIYECHIPGYKFGHSPGAIVNDDSPLVCISQDPILVRAPFNAPAANQALIFGAAHPQVHKLIRAKPG